MSAIPPVLLFLGAVDLTIAMAWAIVARDAWRQLQTQRWSHALMSLLPLLSATLAFVYFSSAIFVYTPVALHAERPSALCLLQALNDVAICLAVALFRHMVRFFSLREDRPTRNWIAVNYGSATAVAVFSICANLLVAMEIASKDVSGYQVVLWGYMALMLGASTRYMLPFARGPWTAGGFAVARRPDAIALLTAVAGMIVVLALMLTGGWTLHRELLCALTALLGIAVLTPFAVRVLGDVIHGLAMAYAMLGAIGIVVLGAVVLDMRFSSQPALRPLVLLVAAAGVALVVGPFRSWLDHALELLVSRRTRHRHEELQNALGELSPEMGARECSARALRHLNRVLQLRGSCLLSSEGGTVAEGDIDAGELDRVWPRDEAAQALRGGLVLDYETILGLPYPVREALHEADAVRVVAISGARRCWGHVVLTTYLAGSTFGEADARAIAGFAHQLGLLLDGVELLERAIRVERSLAHAEKLAAIGELAARMAHEIRNPVTAARSLAQLLSRDPTSPLNAEHAELILTELERVERQVAALLRFARREEFRFEPVDLGELVQETAESFRGRFAEAGIEVAIEAEPGHQVRADREKLRQALLNLVENAVDALEERGDARRLGVSLGGGNGSCAVVVQDNGPGVPDDALPRLFEPFFSLKQTGTGLGLAIVRRTIEAHGGTVAASRGNGGGMRFCIELPRPDGDAVRWPA